MASKPIEITKSVKHVFTDEEKTRIDLEFHQAYSDVKAIKAEAKSSADLYKSKISAAESQQSTLHAKRQAGFEYRDKKCIVFMFPSTGKKCFFLPEQLVDGGLPTPLPEPVLTEVMTQADYQDELFQAESAFDPKEECKLWEAGNDKGVMVVGKQNGKWYGAVRANIGANKIEERLDGEQAASKKRPDCVKQTMRRCIKWIESVTDREVVKGFKNELALIEAQHAEREE